MSADLRRQVPRHYLRGNQTQRSPGRVAIIDTEGRLRDNGRDHQLRCWVARLLRRHGITPSLPRQEQVEGTDATALTEWISAQARNDLALYVFAHGATYDLVVTRLPVLLGREGWELGKSGLISDSPWSNWRRENHHLHLVDLYSHIPRPLAEIGDRIGIPKRPLPDWSAPDQEWLERCRQDVEITAAAALHYLDWWDQKQVGFFANTGPRAGWNAFRHRFQDQKVLIEAEPELQKWERQTIYGGRRQLWAKGRHEEAWICDLDFKDAHLSICATQALPVMRGSAFDSLPLDSHLLDHLGRGVIAEAEIETETPRYPLRLGREIAHPRGRFRTLLCAPELAYARQLGELRSIGPGRTYRLGFAMEAWADWIKGLLDPEHPDSSGLIAMIAKGWARTVPGTWAMRTSRQDFELPSPERGWRITRGTDHDSGAPRVIQHLNGRETWYLQDQEADNGFPAVLAWIQSYVRVLLDRLITALGPGAVIVCNTDGVLVWAESLAQLVDDPGTWQRGAQECRQMAELACSQLALATRPITLQVKGISDLARVLGPQHRILGQEKRLSGVPRTAKEVSQWIYEFETWPRLGWQLSFGEPGLYRQDQRRVDLNDMHWLGWEYADGCSEPPRVCPGPNGGHVIQPPDSLTCPRHGSPLGEQQHSALKSILASLTYAR